MRRLKRTVRLVIERAEANLFIAANRGSAVECPCCSGSFARFRCVHPLRHDGVYPRRAEVCPRCGSMARQRFLALYLRDYLAGRMPPVRVLHFAPERGMFELLRPDPRLDYTTGDLQPLRRVHRIVDVTNIPFDDSSVDLVLCSHVLEYVPDDCRAVQELCRILRPDGQCLLQVPVDPRAERTAPTATAGAAPFDEAWIYGRDFVSRLRSFGADVDVVTPMALGGSAIARYRLEDRGRAPGTTLYVLSARAAKPSRRGDGRATTNVARAQQSAARE